MKFYRLLSPWNQGGEHAQYVSAGWAVTVADQRTADYLLEVKVLKPIEKLDAKDEKRGVPQIERVFTPEEIERMRADRKAGEEVKPSVHVLKPDDKTEARLAALEKKFDALLERLNGAIQPNPDSAAGKRAGKPRGS